MYRDYLARSAWSDITDTLGRPEVDGLGFGSWLVGDAAWTAVLPDPDVATPRNEGDGDLPADTTTTGVITAGETFEGELDSAGDIDWIALDVVAGETYIINLVGQDVQRGDGTTAVALDDTVLQIYDANGDLVAEDDDGGQGTFSRLSYTADADGRIYLAARDFDDDDAGGYAITVGQSGSDSLPADSTTTGVITIGEIFDGELEVEGDRDWIALEVVAGTTYTIDLFGQDLTDGGGTVFAVGDTVLRLYDADGVLIDENDDGDSAFDFDDEGLFSFLTFTAEQSGTVYVSAGGFDDEETGGYGVLVNTLGDDFAADTSTTGVLTLGGTATGRIETSGDSDWFRFDVADASQAVTFAINGDAGADLSLYDSDGDFVQAIGQSASVSFAAAGTYYVSVDGGETIGDYTVVATTGEDDFASDTSTTGAVSAALPATGTIDFEGDEDWFAFDALAEETYAFTLEAVAAGVVAVYDANGDAVEDALSFDLGTAYFTADQAGQYFVGVSGSDVAETYTLFLDTIEDAVGDTPADATPIRVGDTVESDLFGRADVDVFSFEVQAGTRYEFGPSFSSTDDEEGPLFLDLIPVILDAQGNVLGRGDVLNAFYEGTVYVALSYNEAIDYTFTLETSPIVPDTLPTLGEIADIRDIAVDTATGDAFATTDSGLLLRVDAQTEEVVEVFGLGGQPNGVVLSEDGTTAYVVQGQLAPGTGDDASNGPNSVIQVVDLATGIITEIRPQTTVMEIVDGVGVIRTVDLAAELYEIDIDADGNLAVTTTDGELYAIDPDTGQGTGNLAFPLADGLTSIELDENGELGVYLSGGPEPFVTVFDIPDGSVVSFGDAGDLGLFDVPAGAADISAEAGLVAVGATLLDLQLNVLADLAVIDDGGEFIGFRNTLDVAFSADGAQLYVLEAAFDPDTETGSLTLNIFDTVNYDVITALALDAGLIPQGLGRFGDNGFALSNIALSDDGTSLAVGGPGGIDVIDMTQLAFDITGTEGDDVLTGGVGDDDLVGLAGDDTLTGGRGSDRIDGGDGDDTVSYSNSDAGVRVYLTSGSNSDGDTLVSIENVVGSQFADRLIGSTDGSSVEGLGGDDIIVGFGGSDALFGGAGNDRIVSRDGGDLLDGGDGDDTLVSGSGDDTLLGGRGNDRLISNGGDDDLDGGDGDDTLVSGDGADILSGGDGMDRLIAGEGRDVLDGGLGDDTLLGQGGDDDLSGGDGFDRLFGGDGDDVLIGGAGRDILYGDAGNDRIISDGGNDVLRGGTGNDIFDIRLEDSQTVGIVIRDFTDGEDLLDLSQSGLTGGTLEEMGVTITTFRDAIVLDLDGRGTITLLDFDIADFTDDDVIFDLPLT